MEVVNAIHKTKINNLNNKIMKKYIIIDWAYNHLFQDQTWDTSEEAWDFLLQNFMNDNDLQEYNVIRKSRLVLENGII